MSAHLIIFLVIICLILVLIIFNSIIKKKLSIPYSLMWLSYLFLILLALLLPNTVSFLASLLGFEVASNMIFFFGFIALLLIALTLTIIVSKQKDQINILTQEVAILQKEMEDQK